MAIAFQTASGKYNASSGASVVITAPASIALGDLLYAFIDDGSFTHTDITPPSGFTFDNEKVQGSDSQIAYFKKADAGDVAAGSFTFSSAGTGANSGIMVRYSGQDGTTPRDATTTINSANSNTPTITGITTVTDNAVVLWSASDGGGDLPGKPANCNARSSGSGAVSGQSVADRLITPAGATGTEAMSTTFPGLDDWDVILVAVRPAASGTLPISAPQALMPRRLTPSSRRQRPFISASRLAYPAVAAGTAIALTAAITASCAVAGTNTESVAVSAPLVASVAVAATDTKTVALSASLTASVVVTGTNSEAVALSAPLTASAGLTSTDTKAVALSASLTASAATAGTNAQAVALSAALTATSAVAGTDTKAVALSAPLTASSAAVGANTEAVALSAAISPSAAVAGNITSGGAGALTAAISAAASVSATNKEAVALGASLAAASAIASSNSEAVGLSAGLSGSVAIAGALVLIPTGVTLYHRMTSVAYLSAATETRPATSLSDSAQTQLSDLAPNPNVTETRPATQQDSRVEGQP